MRIERKFKVGDEIKLDEFKIGEVVYYIKPHKYGNTPQIWFGIVNEYYGRYGYEVQIYDFADWRIINGVPIEEVETPTKWQRLPKGWNYDTELMKVTYREIPENCRNLNVLKNPQDILKAIQEGLFVKVCDKHYCDFDVEISEQGWRINRCYNDIFSIPVNYVMFNSAEIYKTYDEAQKVIDEYYAELKRQSELSDLEWSIEQIENTIDRWAGVYQKSKEEKEKVKNFLMSLDNLEDVETRIYMGKIQWKYEGNKKWIDILIEN